MILADLAFKLLCKTLDKANQYICGKTGHQYNTEIMPSDDGDTYVLDPLSSCTYCGLMLPMKIYDDVIGRIQLERGEPDVELW